MAELSVNQAQTQEPTRRIERKIDQAGNPTTSVWEDRNGDGKLDLYSYTEIMPTYDCCTHEFTYFDYDGDGYYDKKVEKITSHMIDSSGKSGKVEIIEEEFNKKDKTTKMEHLINKVNNVIKKLPTLKAIHY